MALRVALGDQVTKGQLIAEIDASTERNALEIAQKTTLPSAIPQAGVPINFCSHSESVAWSI